VKLFLSISSRHPKDQDVKCSYASDNSSTEMKMSVEQCWNDIDGGEMGRNIRRYPYRCSFKYSARTSQRTNCLLYERNTL